MLKRSKDQANPAAQCLERAPVDVPAPCPDHEPLPRRLYLRQSDFWRTGRGITALVAGRLSVVVLHRDTLRSVEVVSRKVKKTEVGNALTLQLSAWLTHLRNVQHGEFDFQKAQEIKSRVVREYSRNGSAGSIVTTC